MDQFRRVWGVGSATSASGASTMRECVRAIDINEDPLVDVDIDEDDGNSRTQRQLISMKTLWLSLLLV